MDFGDFLVAKPTARPRDVAPMSYGKSIPTTTTTTTSTTLQPTDIKHSILVYWPWSLIYLSLLPVPWPLAQPWPKSEIHSSGFNLRLQTLDLCTYVRA